jgi:hypothetical protein
MHRIAFVLSETTNIIGHFTTVLLGSANSGRQGEKAVRAQLCSYGVYNRDEARKLCSPKPLRNAANEILVMHKGQLRERGASNCAISMASTTSSTSCNTATKNSPPPQLLPHLGVA